MSLRDALERLPDEALVPVGWIRAHLDGIDVTPALVVENGDDRAHQTWRERLWTVVPATRLGVQELSEALGRSAHFVYRRTSSKADQNGCRPIPHRKLAGELVFVVGEIRRWIEEEEEL